MDTIKKKMLVLIIAICMWLIILYVFLLEVSVNDDFIIICGIIEVMVTIFLVFLLAKFYRNYKDAKLIIENTIIRIPLALIKEDCDKIIETYISCFGVLIDSKVIKYNVGNINLKSVEINSEYICINSGKGEKSHQTCILHGIIEEKDLQLILKRFRYETGIMPTLKHYPKYKEEIK